MTPSSTPFNLTRQEKVFTMVGALLGMLLAALDQTIVATAGPAILRELEIDPGLYAWITTSYMAASTVLVPVYGKLSDLFGRRNILAVGIVTFLVGSLLCGLSRTGVQLILARALQGAGSASLMTSAFAVIADLFPPAERSRYSGIFGSVFGLSSVAGPLVGGFLTDQWGWHWVFFVNLPIGAVALLFVLTKMPALRRPRTGPTKLDYAGPLALCLGVVPLLVALSLGGGGVGGTPRWTSPEVLGLGAVSLLALAWFVWAERRAVDPMLDLNLFRNRSFALGNLASLVVGATFLSGVVFLPVFMVNVLGASATRAGLTVTPLTFAIVAGNVLVGQLVARLGRYKAVLVTSLVVQCLAFGWMGLTLTPESTQAEVTVKMVLLGLGLGPSIPLYVVAIQSAVTPERIGVATATATFSRQMGATIGVAILGTVFGAALHGHMGGRPLTPHAAAAERAPHFQTQVTREAFSLATRRVYQWDVGIALLALLLTLQMPALQLEKRR